jgi:predicted RND superfamily exporter protein
MVLPYIFRIINFAKNQWFGSLLLLLFIIYLFLPNQSIKQYNKNNITFSKKIDSLSDLVIKNKKVIDSLKKIDTVYVNKIKSIKQVHYEKNRIIDSLPTSELQRYFTEHYPE